VQYSSPGPELPIDDRMDSPTQAEGGDQELDRKLNLSLAELELSVRATNCLESEGITTVRDLVIRNDEELLEVRNFGETTLKEVKQKLQERGLHLGMKLPAARR
jgi:DNA-directed RNA polymerase subunit alpha